MKRRNDFEIFPAGKPLQKLLTPFLKWVEGQRDKELDKVTDSWNQLLEPPYRERTKVEKFQDGLLFIKVSSATVHSILEMQEKKRLIGEMQKRHPRLGLKNIVFRR